MAIILRSVKGSNLIADEVDGNFVDLDTRLTSVETDPPEGVGVVGFVVTGSTFTVELSNGSEFGPYNLPTAVFRWTGEYVPGTIYDPLDMFQVPDFGVYLVLQEYEAPTEFDPAVENTDGPLLQLIFGIASPAVIPLVAMDGSFTLTADQAGSYIRADAATPVLVEVPLNAVTLIEVGSTYTIRQVGAGQVTIDPIGGVTVNSPETLSARKEGSTLTLIKVETDEWDLSGDLELTP